MPEAIRHLRTSSLPQTCLACPPDQLADVWDGLWFGLEAAPLDAVGKHGAAKAVMAFAMQARVQSFRWANFVARRLVARRPASVAILKNLRDENRNFLLIVFCC